MCKLKAGADPVYVRPVLQLIVCHMYRMECISRSYTNCNTLLLDECDYLLLLGAGSWIFLHPALMTCELVCRYYHQKSNVIVSVNINHKVRLLSCNRHSQNRKPFSVAAWTLQILALFRYCARHCQSSPLKIVRLWTAWQLYPLRRT